MTIHFYLDNEEETEITSFYDLASNPFKVGDVISLTVGILYPVEYNKYSFETQQKMVIKNEELEAKFNKRAVKIIKESKYLRIEPIQESALTIEYHCEYSE